MAGLCQHDLGVASLAGDPSSPIHRLDPRAKLAVLVAVTLVAISAPLRAWPAWAACAVTLVAIGVVARVPPGVVWQRARIVLPLVLFVAAFVPFVRRGGTTYDLGPLTVSGAGLETFAATAAKATIGTVSAVLLGATTAFPAVVRSLESLHLPRLLVLIALLTYRYLFVVVAEVRRLRAALAARAYRPRHALQAGALGRAASALFLRTHARGERIYLAMTARGFQGTMPHLAPLSFGRPDALFVVGVVAPLVALRIAAELRL